MAYDKQLADCIKSLLVGHPDITEKKMFGGHAFLVQGHMAIAASGQGGLLVRLDPVVAETLIDEPAIQTAIMRGRPMRGWLRVSDEQLNVPADIAPWVERSTAYARSLPAKRG